MSSVDYYVSAIGYNSDETHIAKLRVHEVMVGSTKLKPAQELTRPKVIEMIEKGKRFSTMFQKAEGNWVVGAPLQIVPMTTKYLKTKNDQTTKDNLENLPLF
ncbi:hypothetical protein A7D16_19890 [Xanthomonas nasturtii]|uniref:DUF3892 domain-containing protein n=1 Tax=Xanthomonas nasturtii TaxID=1843581 RepID=UPI0007E43DB2|nr:DUF3892 domain-containing protein [Xanthomonas nasturtii]OAX86289.1 hypothetical protein A7D16_19890 [Xanthomonas nasturtii]WVL58084.1 DUF3892 domain-containing protein [Xanthomonas nasturtii]